MKVVFEIKGDFEVDGTDFADNLRALEEAVDELRTFGGAEGKYKVIVDTTEWVKL